MLRAHIEGSSMRVLHVMASRANGGAETYSVDMIESLHRSGVAQLAIVPRSAMAHERLAAAGVPLAPEVLDKPLTLWRRRKLDAVRMRFKPELVHCWMRRAASLVPQLQIPVVGWFGGFYEPAHFRSCTHFIGVTEGIVAHMAAHGVPPARAYYVPTFPTIEDSAPVERASVATPRDAIVLLALSRLHEKKGLDVLLQALTELPQCVAWLAGDGPLEAELKARADQLGVAERVRFLGWRTDRGALLRAADVCVLPSRWEPFGTVMLEAWATGRPLVAAASQGPSALIEHGINGLLVPVDDAGALAAALRRLIDDTELRERLIARGRADYLKGYTREAATERLLKVYREVIGTDRGGTEIAEEQR
jgi:hypothetical protein